MTSAGIEAVEIDPAEPGDRGTSAGKDLAMLRR